MLQLSSFWRRLQTSQNGNSLDKSHLPLNESMSLQEMKGMVDDALLSQQISECTQQGFLPYILFILVKLSLNNFITNLPKLCEVREPIPYKVFLTWKFFYLG